MLVLLPPMNKPDLQPILTGTLLELRPLQAGDWEALYAAASDPKIWEQHPASDRYQEEVFRDFFNDALASRGTLVAIDRQTGRIVGSSRYFLHENGELEIGWTFLARSHWGGPHNREMKQLMLDHAFSFTDSVIFLVGAANLRSRRALEKIGAVLTGRSFTRDLRGKPVEHVIYQIQAHTKATKGTK
jgi:RimJ/RimL family protein N-acetyltransferase